MDDAIRPEELESTTEIVTESVGPAIEQITPPQSLKAKLASSTALPPDDAVPDDAAPDYAALGVAESDIPKFERLRLRFTNLGRRNTAQVYECGEIVHQMHMLVPDQAGFDKTTQAVLGLTRTGAANYERVYLNLAPYRARLVRLGLVASSLYDLATAEPGKVEEVLAARESGKVLTGAQIKAMLGKTSKSPASPDDGGPDGLKAAVAAKSSHATKAFLDTALKMLRAAHILLEPHREGRAVNKGNAVAELMHDARLAGGLVESLVYAAQIPGGRVPAGIIHVLPVADNRWGAVRRLFYDLGAVESWPKSEQVGTWLEQRVLPELEWAVGAEQAEKARGVLVDRAAAAEADRAKAEQARERAKADAKKAREKARRAQAEGDKRAQREAKAVAKSAKVTKAADPFAIDPSANA